MEILKIVIHHSIAGKQNKQTDTLIESCNSYDSGL